MNWADFSAFVLSPGVPLTHPKPHWTVDLAHSEGKIGLELKDQTEVYKPLS